MKRETLNVLRHKHLKRYIVQNHTSKRWHWNEGTTYVLQVEEGCFEVSDNHDVYFVTDYRGQFISEEYDFKKRVAWMKWVLCERDTNPLYDEKLYS